MKPVGGTSDTAGALRRDHLIPMESDMGGILLWLIGIPIPIIILLYFIF